ncbi:probable leucine-rich repeat receptor-like protein kinase At1g68400 [Dendrobium catenatum]|uniref:probable leucine-rich repeat receptor-like protein kinase At1g68400 n=1 Tax=Dendrobium catenatum TaxID=906689 RepID=UPI00109FAE3B|nr:probable leucine-rich repeat receptor-like protein kinase At1g68400 [Dendrobium catenatum]
MELFRHLHFLFLLLLLLSFFKTSSPSHEKPFPDNHDLNTLLSFRSSSNLFNPFLQTWEGRNPCSGSWLGVKCKENTVVSIRLDNASLVGSVTPLLQLNNLKVLSLRRNALSGSLPPMTNLTHPNLKRLFLSHNQLSGTLSINLPSLLSLRVEYNGFSGDLKDFHLPLTMDFNVSANHLTGEISPTLSKFPKSSFGSNLALCGSPLPSCKKAVKMLNREKLADTTVLALQTTVHNFPPDKKDECEIVIFEGGERLSLDCLLKSSAEVLGKGVCGSTYKAFLMMGGSAYYNSNEEKLLVYDYMPNGSLQSLLHGSNERRPLNGVLNWSKTIQILKGAARGLHFLHTYTSRSPIVHGNIKPSNVLIDFDGNGRISEWGLMSLTNTLHQPNSSSSTVLYNKADGANSSNWHNYRAPELLTGKAKATQESDVYSFGMVILKVVTCKEIEDGAGEEELMCLIKIGMMCTTESPEERPQMAQVLCLMNEFFRV